MATSYDWKNITLDAYTSMYGQTDVVYRISADLVCIDKGTSTELVTIGVAYNEAASFTAFEDITKAEAISWIEAALAPAELAKIKARLLSQASKVNSRVLQDT